VPTALACGAFDQRFASEGWGWTWLYIDVAAGFSLFLPSHLNPARVLAMLLASFWRGSTLLISVTEGR
jgi:hypothetical protein